MSVSTTPNFMYLLVSKMPLISKTWNIAHPGNPHLLDRIWFEAHVYSTLCHSPIKIQCPFLFRIQVEHHHRFIKLHVEPYHIGSVKTSMATMWPFEIWHMSYCLFLGSLSVHNIVVINILKHCGCHCLIQQSLYLFFLITVVRTSTPTIWFVTSCTLHFVHW